MSLFSALTYAKRFLPFVNNNVNQSTCASKIIRPTYCPSELHPHISDILRDLHQYIAIDLYHRALTYIPITFLSPDVKAFIQICAARKYACIETRYHRLPLADLAPDRSRC